MEKQVLVGRWGFPGLTPRLVTEAPTGHRSVLECDYAAFIDTILVCNIPQDKMYLLPPINRGYGDWKIRNLSVSVRYMMTADGILSKLNCTLDFIRMMTEHFHGDEYTVCKVDSRQSPTVLHNYELPADLLSTNAVVSGLYYTDLTVLYGDMTSRFTIEKVAYMWFVENKYHSCAIDIIQAGKRTACIVAVGDIDHTGPRATAIDIVATKFGQYVKDFIESMSPCAEIYIFAPSFGNIMSGIEHYGQFDKETARALQRVFNITDEVVNLVTKNHGTASSELIYGEDAAIFGNGWVYSSGEQRDSTVANPQLCK